MYVAHIIFIVLDVSALDYQSEPKNWLRSNSGKHCVRALSLRSVSTSCSAALPHRFSKASPGVWPTQGQTSVCGMAGWWSPQGYLVRGKAESWSLALRDFLGTEAGGWLGATACSCQSEVWPSCSCAGALPGTAILLPEKERPAHRAAGGPTAACTGFIMLALKREQLRPWGPEVLDIYKYSHLGNLHLIEQAG